MEELAKNKRHGEGVVPLGTTKYIREITQETKTIYTTTCQHPAPCYSFSLKFPIFKKKNLDDLGNYILSDLPAYTHDFFKVHPSEVLGAADNINQLRSFAEHYQEMGRY
ncbi:hypothetical protein ACJX0J_018454, partial [Zea mays]